MSAAPAKTADPSMEEILASIRRIIADDDDKAPEAQAKDASPAETPRAAAPANDSHDDDEEDVLDLSTADLTASPDTSLDIELPDLSFHAAPEPEEASAPAPAPMPELEPEPLVAPNPVMEEPAQRAPQSEKPRLAEMASPLPPPAPRPEPAQAAPTRPVAETIVSQATTASVGQAFNLLSHTIMSQNANTLEDIVREMLRPMLKTWLDDNLPPLVERLVAAEIQRVARGQR